jgi:hypothetical protein
MKPFESSDVSVSSFSFLNEPACENRLVEDIFDGKDTLLVLSCFLMLGPERPMIINGIGS